MALMKTHRQMNSISKRTTSVVKWRHRAHGHERAWTRRYKRLCHPCSATSIKFAVRTRFQNVKLIIHDEGVGFSCRYLVGNRLEDRLPAALWGDGRERRGQIRSVRGWVSSHPSLAFTHSTFLCRCHWRLQSAGLSQMSFYLIAAVISPQQPNSWWRSTECYIFLISSNLKKNDEHVASSLCFIQTHTTTIRARLH